MKIPVTKKGRPKGVKDFKPRLKRGRFNKKSAGPSEKRPHDDIPFGAPPDFNKSSKKMRNELMRALEAEGHKQGQSPMQRVAESFYNDPKAMVKVLKHLLPQLKAIELKGLEESPFKLIMQIGGEIVKDKDENEEEDDG